MIYISNTIKDTINTIKYATQSFYILRNPA